MFSLVSACLSVFLSVRQITQKVTRTDFGGVGRGPKASLLDFGGYPDHAADTGIF